MLQLEEIVRTLDGLPRERRAEIEREAIQYTAHMRWVPNPGPQSEAFACQADELFYGGQAGGGKTDLAVALALECHQRSLILREFKDDARAMGDRLVEIAGSRDGWNENIGRWRRGNQVVDFDGLPNEKDKQRHKGKPHDLIVFDEIGDFYESQFDFIVGWNRSTDPNQRCRVLCTGNPPTRSKGLWVIKRWGPWLDPKHPRPAKDGELRWYMRNAEGEETEVDGPGPYQVEGEAEPVRAKSRTFIRARLKDNPDLARTNYAATLAALPKELRDAYRDGKFDASLKDHPFQVIPTAWVVAAQQRWTPRPPQGVPMCGMGVDPAQGGKDRFTIACRYDGWYAPTVCIPGSEIKLGSQGAGHVIAHRRDDADIVVDMGGGYGSGTYETLVTNRIPVSVYKGANASMKRTSDRKLGFVNKRTEVYWLFREALDPDQLGGSPIALPPDPELLGDLTVLTYEVGRRGIEVLQKEKVVEILGRSPDKGDATVLAWSAGPRGIAPMNGSAQFGREQRLPPPGQRSGRPQLDLGPRHRARR